MKIKKTILHIAFIGVMCILCMIAVFTAVDISIAMMRRENHALKLTPAPEPEKVQVAVVPVKLGKLAEIDLYFNGVKFDGVKAYKTQKKEFYLPLDTIFNLLEVPFKYFSSDETVTADILGQKLVVKLGADRITLDGREIKLKAPSVAAANHILIPAESFEMLEGFQISQLNDKKLVFVNYYPYFEKDLDTPVRLLKFAHGTAQIQDLHKEHPIWDGTDLVHVDVQAEAAKDGSVYVLKSRDKTYLINKKHPLPYEVKTGSSATLSSDGKYLYWIDKVLKTSYLFNIETGKTKKLGNYYSRIKNSDAQKGSISTGDVLDSYTEGKTFKRIVLSDALRSSNYTFIDRKKETVIEGKVLYSPDKTKILYSGKNGWFYLANSDGTNSVLLSKYKGVQYRWVNNNRIFMVQGKERFVLDGRGKNKKLVNQDWKSIGKAPGGEVFFTVGSTLYCESKGKENNIMELPWSCEYLTASSPEGPYMAVVRGHIDSVFYIRNNKILNLGKASLLLKQKPEFTGEMDYAGSIVSSPKNNYSVVVQREALVSLTIVHQADGSKQKLVLNDFTNNTDQPVYLQLKWIADEKLLIISEKNGWIVDCKNKFQVYQWAEDEGTRIIGILP